MQRRRFLQGVAVTTAAAVAPEANAEAAIDSVAAATPRSQPDELWELMAPYTAGTVVGLGWSVAGLFRDNPAAVRLTLTHVSGERAEVRLCARMGAPRGVAHCEQVDLILVNHGDGRQPTDEDLGRVIKTLAAQMRRNEKQGAQLTGSRLMPHAMGAGHFNGRTSSLE